MSGMKEYIEQADDELLPRLVIDAFRRIVVHYGYWFAQVEHQLGMEKAMNVEQEVWDASIGNQLKRLGKTFGFPVENGIPAVIRNMPKADLIDLLEKLGINWLANDGIWFQAVEKTYGMNDAKRCNDTCWTRYSPFEAERIKQLLELPDDGGIPALKKALAFRMYALINKQSIEDVDDNCIIFRMNECRVQAARKRRGLDDYPCKSVGNVEYPYFARAVDKRIVTECIGCPPDEHPEDWFCAWRFTIKT
ncbi:MAG: cytosolic protein [Desulfobacteraceae bacterium 4572_88]|nr:MAG: cytosolic protein [Desulfobacteraceae bacterium 4572_88]